MKYLTDYIKEKNENTLVVGGAASGKTSLVVLPTLLQRDGSYIFYDATGMQYQKLAADFLRVSVMSIEQVQMLYPCKWEQIVRSFHNVIYLGTCEPKTIGYMKKYLTSVGAYRKEFKASTGKETSSEFALYEQFLDKKIYGNIDDVVLVSHDRESYVFPKRSFKQFFVE